MSAVSGAVEMVGWLPMSPVWQCERMADGPGAVALPEMSEADVCDGRNDL